MATMFSPAWQRYFGLDTPAPAAAASAAHALSPTRVAVEGNVGDARRTPHPAPASGQRYTQTPPIGSAGGSPARPPVAPATVPAGPTIGRFPTGGHAGTVDGGTSAFAPPAGGVGAPPIRPRPPVDQRPIPAEPPRRARELAWLTWQMPGRLREDASVHLRQTLDWRAQYCQPLDAPETPAEYTRFGLLGELLWPKGAFTVCKALREELRETTRTLEAAQPVLVRNRLLAMHSVRLGQLCAELEQRGLDTLETIRDGLGRLWA